MYDHCVLESCQGCKLRTDGAFCNLSPEALQALDQISYPVSYPGHAILFSEEVPCRAVFVLCSGRAKLSTAARDGRKVMLRVAEAGEVLGLSSVLTRKQYRAAAETLSPALVRVLKREDFLDFVRSFPETSARLMAALQQEYEAALLSLRSLAWFPSAAARVAQLLLNLSSKASGFRPGPRTKLLLTQEQIAQMTATSRETVTRLLSQLRRDQVIAIRGSDLVIRDRTALERLAC